MSTFARLSNTDSEAALDLLMREPDRNIIMIHNVRVFGMEPGETRFHGDYVGRWAAGRLDAIGAVYGGLGSFFLYAADDGSVEGMAECMLEFSGIPSFMSGRASHLERLFEGFDGLEGVRHWRYPSDHMVLSGRVRTGIDTCAGRFTETRDLDTVVKMQAAMGKELFDADPADTSGLRELLAQQIGSGGARVLESDGAVVSKAEATVAEGVGAQLGGVYTMPGHRGRGYATSCVGSLCEHVLARAPLVALTVDKDNYPAKNVYHRIGFEKADDWMIVTTVPF